MESPSAAGRNSIFNRRQLVALWAGLAVFSLAALFPPWHKRDALFPRDKFIERPLGRHAWWSPPKDWSLETRRSPNRFLDQPGDSVRVFIESAEIHYTQLITELAVVTLLTGGLVVTLHRRRSQAEAGTLTPRSP